MVFNPPAPLTDEQFDFVDSILEKGKYDKGRLNKIRTASENANQINND